MRIVLSSEATVQDPTDEVIAFCLENFTMKNPEFQNKMRRGLYLGNTPEYLDLYKSGATI